MTRWEIGQDLIAISDYIAEKEVEFRREKHTVLADKMRLIRMHVGDIFNDNNDHSFKILDSSDLN
jgi:hypothetical protein